MVFHAGLRRHGLGCSRRAAAILDEILTLPCSWSSPSRRSFQSCNPIYPRKVLVRAFPALLWALLVMAVMIAEHERFAESRHTSVERVHVSAHPACRTLHPRALASMALCNVSGQHLGRTHSSSLHLMCCSQVRCEMLGKSQQVPL